jgi:hypothetical protein
MIVERQRATRFDDWISGFQGGSCGDCNKTLCSPVEVSEEITASIFNSEQRATKTTGRESDLCSVLLLRIPEVSGSDPNKEGSLLP